jgi:hypothetical protein
MRGGVFADPAIDRRGVQQGDIAITTDAFIVRLTGLEPVLRRFLHEHPAEPQFVQREGEHVSLQVVLRQKALGLLQTEFKGGIRAEVLFNASERGRSRLRRGKPGNRFAGDGIPEGLGAAYR